MKPYILSGSTIKGMNAYNSRGYRIGRVEDIMIDKENAEVLPALIKLTGRSIRRRNL